MSASRQDERVAATARSGASLSHVLLYFVLAYAISWAWVIPLAATGHTVAQGRGWPTHLPSLVGPMVAALLVTAWDAGGPGVRDLLARMARWRIGWRWWLAAVSPLLVFVAVLVVLAVAGTDLPAGNNFADFSGISSGLGLLVVWSLILLVNGFGEETGWRGYALAQLQRRWSPVAAAFLVAAGWAVWHIPQFFLLQSYEDFSIPMIPVFLVGLAGGSVVLTWLYNRSGSSILAVAVWHGLYNATGATGASRRYRPALHWRPALKGDASRSHVCAAVPNVPKRRSDRPPVGERGSRAERRWRVRGAEARGAGDSGANRCTHRYSIT